MTTPSFRYYRDNVHSDLVAECAICHKVGATAPEWLAVDETDVLANYEKIEGHGSLIHVPACSEIITKSNGEHVGPPLSPTLEFNTISWLELEAEERGLTCEVGGGGGGNVVEMCDGLLVAFQDCMHLSHWQMTGMDLLPLQQITGDSAACYSCHSVGQSPVLSTDPAETMYAHKYDKFTVLRLVHCGIESGQVVGLVPAGRYINKGIEPCVLEPCHPEYILTAANLAAVTDFVDQVLNALEQGTCDELVGIFE